MSTEDPNRLAYQYLRGSARCEDDYAGPVGPHPGSHSRRLRVVLDCPGARRVRGPNHEDRERAKCAESEASSGVSQRPSGTISRIIAGAIYRR